MMMEIHKYGLRINPSAKILYRRQQNAGIYFRLMARAGNRISRMARSRAATEFIGSRFT